MTTRPPTVVPGLSPAPDRASTGNVIGVNGRCLLGDGNRVEVSVCSGLDVQSWTLGTDGTLRLKGRCAMTTSGAVQLGSCDGGPAQWRIGPNRILVNLAANLCLTDPSNGRPGTGTRVNNCQTAPNQQWTTP